MQKSMLYNPLIVDNTFVVPLKSEPRSVEDNIFHEQRKTTDKTDCFRVCRARFVMGKILSLRVLSVSLLKVKL